LKILKFVLWTLGAIISIVLLGALFTSDKISITKNVIIHLPKDSVFHFVRLGKNQEKYSVWNSLDPEMKKYYKGTDGEIGFEYCWESNNENAGKGCQKIISVEEGKRVEVLLKFTEPFESENHAYVEVEDMGKHSTKVIWGFEGKMPYPLNFLGVFMDMENQIGKDLENNLQRLKKYLESGGR
jgi:hypothetical protein